jgi:hypothetical protein
MEHLTDIKQLQDETAKLLRKQRQRGEEYRFKPSKERPNFQSTIFSLPQEPTLKATIKDVDHQIKEANNASDLLSYDPKRILEEERVKLLEEIVQLRKEASKVHQTKRGLEKQLEEAKLTLHHIQAEDSIEKDIEEGTKIIRRERTKLQQIEKELFDTHCYSDILEQMRKRASDLHLSNLKMLHTYDEGIKVHQQELDLLKGLHIEVIKSRDSEVIELSRMQEKAAAELAAMDAKLEERRKEVIQKRELSEKISEQASVRQVSTCVLILVV